MVDKPGNYFMLPSAEHHEHDISRAIWQRGIGAIIMRELTEEALLVEPNFDHLSPGVVDFEIKEKSHLIQFDDVSRFWKSAYTISTLAARAAFMPIHNKAASMVVRDSPIAPRLGKDFQKYTYWGNIAQSMREIEETVAHFPISLARTICSSAAARDRNLAPRFQPRSLSQVADLLESPDVQTMFDQSLFAANGFWKGFSTSTGEISSTDIKCLPYYFEGDEVRFSTGVIHQMRQSVKAANSKRHRSRKHDLHTTSSGCPARHSEIQIHPSTDVDYLQKIAKYFGKTPDELVAKHDTTPARLGLDLVTKSLRLAHPVVTQLMQKEEARVWALPGLDQSLAVDQLYKP